MRFHVIWRKSHEPEEAYRDFFETNDIYEAKDFAMRLAFDETNLVTFWSAPATRSGTRSSATSTRRSTAEAHKPTASGHTKAGGDFYAQTQAQPGGLSL